MNENRWEYLISAQGDLLAQIFESLLNANGIPVLLSGESVAKIYGLTINELAVVDILVPTKNLAEARQILQDYQTGELADVNLAGDIDAEGEDQPPEDASMLTSD